MINSIHISNYEILEHIGSGGMADVFKAKQISPHRIVAIKALKTEYSEDAVFVRRFEQEAEAVLILSHENIVRSYDVGKDNDRHYIVLEYVEGTTLKEQIQKSGMLKLRTAINIAAQVLDALDHAHSKGIIHRDVKPQNIIVTPRGRAKLADFGIARRTTSTNTQTFMGNNNVLGSVHYISPEQAKGETVSEKSDIYSMGVTLYEMVTGSVPFDADAPVTIAIKHLQDDVVPPKQLNKEVPDALNDIILKAMDKNPENRYHSAKAMRHDILRALREPNGTFAKLKKAPAKTNNNQNSKKNKKSNKVSGLFKIALTAVVLVGLFVVLMLSGQSVWGKSTAASIDLRVPTLQGKTLEEAQEKARLNNYNIEIIGSLMSDQYDEGYVISQTPEAGTPLKAGETIGITISRGSSIEVLAPNVVGMQLSQASQVLSEEGLKTGYIEYRVTEHPIGEVYSQDPLPNSPMSIGDEVMLYVSGEPVLTIESPSVAGLNLDEALSVLSDHGFKNIRIRFIERMDNGAKEKTVTLQSPAVGEPHSSNGLFLLEVYNPKLNYAADITVNVDIPENDSSLLALIKCEKEGIAYTQIVYEDTIKKAGDAQSVPLHIVTDHSGECTLVLYINGTQVREIPVIFSNRG